MTENILIIIPAHRAIGFPDTLYTQNTIAVTRDDIQLEPRPFEESYYEYPDEDLGLTPDVLDLIRRFRRIEIHPEIISWVAEPSTLDIVNSAYMVVYDSFSEGINFPLTINTKYLKNGSYLSVSAFVELRFILGSASSPKFLKSKEFITELQPLLGGLYQ